MLHVSLVRASNYLGNYIVFEAIIIIVIQYWLCFYNKNFIIFITIKKNYYFCSFHSAVTESLQSG